MDYNEFAYLAVTVSPDSYFLQCPTALANIHPLLNYAGPVSALSDVHLLGVSTKKWEKQGGLVIRTLQATLGVARVDVQSTRQRSKRDET
ncbi:hypothetical protein IW261DRAFT_667468 [Armillaria novae-zelandiae]|uniref:Uncharacterized protein n=1 Tax=Armillaria novae-zelandiae TaxID=153914 RepID=A0AA39TZ60_9AGAR|nr:hypothetical protein IW261DRAFT_667468 [Armillaria novae-zelandiae]